MGTEGANRYQGEPYVLCGDVYGVAPHEGRAGWSWYTGSAGWLYQAAVHHILGISLKRGVLSVNPSIPAQWREWSVTLSRPRPVTITFYNPNGVESGVKEIRVNGDVISERAIKLETYSGEIAIQVFLG
jgi:cellobiose phosphorylase